MTIEPFLQSSTLTAQSVIDYLQAHPDFLVNHTDLFNQLSRSRHTNGTTSFSEHQAKVQQETIKQLKQQMNELVGIAHDNDKINQRVRALTLKLLDAKTPDKQLSALHDCLTTDFNTDIVTLNLFSNSSQHPENSILEIRYIDRADESLTTFEELLQVGKFSCGKLKPEILKWLFGQQTEQIRSAVFLPLGTDHCFGVLGLGSFDENRYHATQGTLFLSFLSEIISHSLQRHFKL
ncbi:MAG TPA: DUF484 family protein [Gammaproteobacteria bacterium]|nr:DUF484 family protein [Gammaproteobacteria bacterium]